MNLAAEPAPRRSRFEVTAQFSGPESRGVDEVDTAKVADALRRDNGPEKAARGTFPASRLPALGDSPSEEIAAAETTIVDGEVFDKPARGVEQPRPAVSRSAQPAPVRAPELDDADYEFVNRRRGRGGYDPRADQEAARNRAIRRQRTTLAIFLAVVVAAICAQFLSAALWPVVAAGTAFLVAYLWLLRRQVRREQQIRARRIERLRRARLGVESRHDEELSVVPERLRRPGSVVVEVDDEDPIFDHLANGRYEDDRGQGRPVRDGRFDYAAHESPRRAV